MPGQPSAPGAAPSKPTQPGKAAAAPEKKAPEESDQDNGAVENIFSGARLRDPMAMPSAGGAAPSPAAAQGQEGEAFSIHSLALKGIMKDRTGDFAILVSKSGLTYFLKKGRVYDLKNKPVRGVSGKVFAAQKKVLLQAPDQDVQTLILGEDDSQGGEDSQDGEG